MAGLVPAIHDFPEVAEESKSWMTRTSPVMTDEMTGTSHVPGQPDGLARGPATTTEAKQPADAEPSGGGPSGGGPSGGGLVPRRDQRPQRVHPLRPAPGAERLAGHAAGGPGGQQRLQAGGDVGHPDALQELLRQHGALEVAADEDRV